MRTIALVLALAALPCSVLADGYDIEARSRIASSMSMLFDFSFSGKSYPDIGPSSYCWSMEGLTSDCAGTLPLTAAGTPTLFYDTTWPLGFDGTQGRGYKLDGTGDYLYSSSASALNPAGAFSVMVVYTPFTGFTTGDTLVSKGTPTANQRGWRMYSSSATQLAFAVSDDGTAAGGHITTLTVSSASAIGRMSCAVASYSGGTDGAISGFLVVDELTATTSTTMDGPVFANTGNLTVGADGDGSGDAPVIINHLEYADVALTQAQALEKCRRWKNLVDKYGEVVTVTYSAPAAFPLAPPNSGAEPFVVTTPQNSNRAGKPGGNNGGLYGSSGLTNQLYRSQICKTSSGGHPNAGGWDIPTETAGDGTADVICDTARYAEGFESLRMDLTGTTSVAQQCSICYTSASVIKTRYNLDAWVLPSTNSTPALTLEEYDAADCTTLLATNTASRYRDTDLWDKYNLNVAFSTWNTSTSSYRICMTETCDGGCTTYWDAPQLRATSAPTGVFAVPTDGFCGSDADAVAACSSNYAAITNKLDYASPWEIAIDASTPSDGTDTVYLYILPKTGGTNENRLQAIISNPGRFTLYDGSSTSYTTDPAGYIFSSDTERKFKIQRDMGASLRACVDGSCDATPATGAVNTDYSATAYLGGTSASYNVWTKRFAIKKRPTIISTGPGWNTSPDYFSVFQLSDTQIYAETHPDLLSDTVDWVVANATGHKLAMIMHTGDVVNTESVAQQWTDSDTYFTRFDTASIPWMVTTGNHDFCTPWSSCPSGTPTTYLSLFGSARFSGFSYWGGTSANDLNHWTTVTVMGQQYIFIMVEMDQPAAAISWAAGVIAAHPGVPVFIGTHQYLLDDTQARSSSRVFRTGGQGGDALWAMAKTYDEVRVIMSGHYVNASGEGVQVSVNDFGHNVYEFIANYQERYYGGDGIVRMYRVYPTINLMQMRTYSSRKNTWDLDYESMRDFVWRS